MKKLLVALAAVAAAGSAFAESSNKPEFETVLEITSPDYKQLSVDLAPVAPARVPAATASFAADTPAIPLIGATGAADAQSDSVNPVAPGPVAPGAPTPVQHFNSMQQAAESGLDPLNLRTSTAVLKQDKLSNVDERSLLQVALDEWTLVRGMSGAELIEWAKANPAIPGGLLAVMVGGFALLLNLFKRR